MPKIIAIDPGPEKSAYVVWDGKTVWFKGIEDNEELESMLGGSIEFNGIKYVIFEWVQSYGMPVGESVFKTAYTVGCFSYAARLADRDIRLIARRFVKLHLCEDMRAKDSNIIQALIDRFAPLTPNRGKGNKKNPGFFYGFKKDIWQAFALAVAWYDVNVSQGM